MQNTRSIRKQLFFGSQPQRVGFIQLFGGQKYCATNPQFGNIVNDGEVAESRYRFFDFAVKHFGKL